MALIENGQRLLDVRNKLNAALQPYASRAIFESTSVPVDILSVQVIEDDQLYLLYRTGAGDWVSGDGAIWSAVSLTSLAAPDATKVSSRSAFVTLNATGILDALPDGSTLMVDGLAYVRREDATAIPDLPGWVPGGAMWDIRQWGAVEGQASQDCGAILQQAFEAARDVYAVPPRYAGACIYIPEGEWWFHTRAVVNIAPLGTTAGPRGIEVYGAGDNITSLIAAADNSDGIMDLYSDRGQDIFHVHGFSILSDLDSDIAENSGVGISIRNTTASSDNPRWTARVEDIYIGGYGLTAGNAASRGNWLKGIFIEKKHNIIMNRIRALARYGQYQAGRTACTHAIHLKTCYSPEITDCVIHGAWDRGIHLEADLDDPQFEDFRLVNSFLVGQRIGYDVDHPHSTDEYRLNKPGGVIMGAHVNCHSFGIRIANHRQVYISGINAFATREATYPNQPEALPAIVLIQSSGDIRIDMQSFEPGYYLDDAHASCAVRIEGYCDAISVRGQFGHGGIGVLNNSTFTSRKSILVDAEMPTSRRIEAGWFPLKSLVDNAGTATLAVRDFGLTQDKVRHKNKKSSASTYPIAMQVGSDLVGQTFVGAYEIYGKNSADSDIAAAILRGMVQTDTAGNEHTLLDLFTQRNGSLVQTVRFNAPVSNNSTGLAMIVQTDGSVALKYVVVGAEDSGGEGYRMLRIAN